MVTQLIDFTRGLFFWVLVLQHIFLVVKNKNKKNSYIWYSCVCEDTGHVQNQKRSWKELVFLGNKDDPMPLQL